MITAKKFIERVGRTPEDDDLERSNCYRAGNIMHCACGWCTVCDLPRFECGHILTPPLIIKETVTK